MIKRISLFFALVMLGALQGSTFALAAGGQLGDAGNNSTLTSGLVGYWSMDGNKINWLTGKVTDSSGQNNNGALINMSTTTSPTAGKVAGALQFNSSTAQEVSLGTAPAGITFAYNQPFSISLWAKPSATVGSGIFDRMVSITASSGKFEYFVMANNSQFSFNLGKNGTGDNSVGGSTFTVGQWYHLVGIYDGTNVQLYINGVKVGSTAYTWGALSNPDGILSIGGGGSTSNTFNGAIDDVRIYNRALASGDVAQLYKTGVATVDHSSTATLQSGLAGYWPLDGNTTNWNIDATIDASGNGNLGQLMGMATTTSPTAGKVGGALLFNGVAGDHVSAVGTTLPIGTTQPFSFSAWVKDKSVASLAYIIELGNSGDTGNPLFITTSSKWRFGVFGGCSIDLNDSSDQNLWVHLAGTFDGNSMRFYKNGILAGGPTACSPNTSAQNFSMGSQINGSNVFNGAIDDVRIYNRALSAQEVQQLYTNGTANIDHSINTTASQNGLLMYYTFDGPKINWTSNTVLDSSGNNFTSATMILPTSTAPTAGKIGQGLKFTGNSGNYIFTPSLGTPAVNMSEVVWIKPNAAGGVVMDEMGTPSVSTGWHDSHIEVETNNSIKVCVWTGTSTCVTAATGITYGKWYQVALTYNNTTQVLSGYTNGVLGASSSGVARQVPNTGTQVFGIGFADVTNGGNGAAFSGIIDDVRVYNKTLSAGDVAALYTLGR